MIADVDYDFLFVVLANMLKFLDTEFNIVCSD